MKILITGGAGYIGLQTVRELRRLGHYCVIFDNLSTGSAELTRQEKMIVGDLLDAQALDAVFRETRFDVVMHFAGASLVSESVERPLFYYEQNVSGTLHLLAAMRAHSVSRIVFSSSAAVYGDVKTDLITEETACRPTNPYGRSKRMVEEILEDLFQREWLQHVCLRYFNAAGADPKEGLGECRKVETHLIPRIFGEIARAQREGRKPVVKIYGQHYPTRDGTCVRDYIHVKDLAAAHAAALHALMEKRNASRLYNVGTGHGHSVLEIVNAASHISGVPVEVHMLPPRPGDPPTLVADATRIRSEWGFAPQHSDVGTILQTAWAWQRGRA